MLNHPDHHTPDADPFRRSRIIPTILTVAAFALLVLLALWNAEAASAKGLKGHCGIQFGALCRIDSGGARYHARIGPRRGHVGGTMHCYGHVFVRSSRAAATTTLDGLSGAWDPFNWRDWRWKGVLALNGTASSRVGFRLALAAEAPTGAIDTWLTPSGGAGCVGGVTYIDTTYIAPHQGTPDYCGARTTACNGPGRVIFGK
jgi:hypothetical protein